MDIVHNYACLYKNVQVWIYIAFVIVIINKDIAIDIQVRLVFDFVLLDMTFETRLFEPSLDKPF